MGMPFLIIFRGVLIGLCTLGAFALVNYTTGNVDAARTTAFMTLVMAQIVHSFECRNENKAGFSRKRVVKCEVGERKRYSFKILFQIQL